MLLDQILLHLQAEAQVQQQYNTMQTTGFKIIMECPTMGNFKILITVTFNAEHQ